MGILAWSFIGWLLALQSYSQDTPWHLVDSKCEAAWAPVLRGTAGFDIVGNCDGKASRLLNLAVTNTSDAGRLHQFSLGFCGEILSANAPTGWTASVVRGVASFGSPATVEWKANSSSGGLQRNDRTIGFSVTLRPGWRRAIAYDAVWENSGTGSGSPHDCGELPR
jgi:hypothetical protein